MRALTYHGAHSVKVDTVPDPQIEQSDDIILRVKNHIRASGERELSSQQIGEWVMIELRQVDPVAYVRFASVYRSFEDVNAFREEVERLQQSPGVTNSA